MLYLMFAKVFPIVSIWEINAGEHEKKEEAKAVSKAVKPLQLAPALVSVRSLLWPVLAAVLVIAGASSTVSAQTCPGHMKQQIAPAVPAATTQKSNATISITVVTEDKEKLVRATVLVDGKPVENAVVQFSAQRTFGNLKLGEDKTLDDGTAAVKFPVGLPGNAAGELVFVAEVKSPPTIAGACTDLTSPGGLPAPPPDANPFPRALWSPRAPIPLLAVLLTMFGGVWITYVFVVSQIVAIKKGARS
jgi:hypothetical protein